MNNWQNNDRPNRIYSSLGLTGVANYLMLGFILLLIAPFHSSALEAKDSLPGKKTDENYYQSWMGKMLQTRNSQLTLKDIVIPGAHDAGMSMLTEVAGQQKGTINSCNTLTQRLNIAGQLNAGIRMFDFRVGTLRDTLFLKHSSSDCVRESVGGAYGEKLSTALEAIRIFLEQNTDEFILISFSHFCETETPLQQIKNEIRTLLGDSMLFAAKEQQLLTEVPLSALAGKVLLLFEVDKADWPYFPPTSMTDSSSLSLNFSRYYASTNHLKKMMGAQENFFKRIGKGGVGLNDLIRLDWQLTQSPTEASMVCNEFQSERVGMVVNSLMLLSNLVGRYKSIIKLADYCNKKLPAAMDEWMSKGIIRRNNKPNILYVDNAGVWITDLCIRLNQHPIYTSE